MSLRVKEYLTKENEQDLESFGFKHNGETYYKYYGEYFEIILNPVINFGKTGMGQVVIDYLNKDVDIEESYIDETYDITEIYEDISLLISCGIIERNNND